ncbi:uncharacterized protein BDR25DRAFT_351472 [Lindgomyces ingoldianus]|uniref:Uncharacterized protein n=1 Tax=Lindgomyces ingoldianus TaxID=673940 RepID=A0ACB6R6W3_9PLEO|nr:uncharacterized protein BDR25DRAFT_351472 [Lindgomyces ingoldianus]KAF2474984.1 hypothetical protein BDR25DRAFT_351472 [Lindgomyces ingoldianus]
MAVDRLDEIRFLFFALFSCLPLYHCFTPDRKPKEEFSSREHLHKENIQVLLDRRPVPGEQFALITVKFQIQLNTITLKHLSFDPETNNPQTRDHPCPRLTRWPKRLNWAFPTPSVPPT